VLDFSLEDAFGHLMRSELGFSAVLLCGIKPRTGHSGGVPTTGVLVWPGVLFALQGCWAEHTSSQLQWGLVSWGYRTAISSTAARDLPVWESCSVQ